MAFVKTKIVIFFMLSLFFPLMILGNTMIKVVPFANKSSFKKKKDLGLQITKVFIQKLNEMKGCKGFTGDDKEYKYRIAGIIEKYNLSTYGIIMPGRAGYVNYSSLVLIKVMVYSNEKKIKTIESEAKIKDNDLGITLFGGPGTHNDTEGFLFEEMHKYPMESKEFKDTLIGKTLYGCIYDLIEKLKKGVFKPQVSEGRTSQYYKIIEVEGNTVYINAGRADFIKEGDSLTVYKKGKKLIDPDTKKVLGYTDKYVGKIKISIIISDYLSKAEIIESKGKIKKGQKASKK